MKLIFQPRYLWFVLFLSFLTSCSSLNPLVQENYAKEFTSAIEKGNWLIKGKISLKSVNNGYSAGSFSWKSQSGDFEIIFFNQVLNQYLEVKGNYFKSPVILNKSGTIYKFDNLNQVLTQVFNWSLNWQDLIFWINYTPPKSAYNLVYFDDSAKNIQKFEFLGYQVQYLSFFDPISSNHDKNKVKLMRIIRQGGLSQVKQPTLRSKVEKSSLKISISKNSIRYFAKHLSQP